MKALSRLAVIASSAGAAVVGILVSIPASIGTAWAGLRQPTPWEMDLQDSASPVMQDVAGFHFFLLWVIAVILPRRYVDYPDAFAGWNFVSSIGSYISGFGVLVFLYGMILAFVRKERAAANPWGSGATTLEWTLPSPPPFHQYETLPLIR
jgi:hypothetical protein